MDKELFESKPIASSYMKLALPVVLSGVLTLVYNMVDMYFVAKTGDTNLVAGVSLCAPIFTLLIAMGDVLGLGGASVMSRLLGQDRTDDARRISIFCLNGAIFLGIIIAFILTVGSSTVLNLLGVDSETYVHASSYYRWIALGSPFVILALAPTNLLRTEGHANAAMIGSVMGSIVNMILDPICIFTLGMGAGGAAVATIIGNICSDIWYIFYITKYSSVLSFSWKNFHISSGEVGSVLKIGIPSSVTNIMQSIGLMMMNHALLIYGNDKVASMGIVSKVTSIVIMIMVGFSFGGQPLYGYLYGAHMKDRMKKVIKFAYQLIIGTSVVLSVVLAIFAPYLITFFMDDNAMVAIGVPMLRIVLCGMPFIGVTMVTTCIFQSTGNARNALILSTARQGYVYLVVLFILSNALGYTGVVMSQPVADLTTSIIAVVLVKGLFKELNGMVTVNSEISVSN